MPYIEKFHGPVNKVEEYILHGTNGEQMWNNGFNNIFCSSNVFIFHSSSGGGQFYAALPSARSACKSMSIKATECSYVTGSSFHQFCSAPVLRLHPCSVRYVYGPRGCYRQMLIMVTHWPPVTSQYTDNELDHLCCVVVTRNFETFVYPAKVYRAFTLLFWQRPSFTLIKFHSVAPGRCSL